MRRGDLLVLRAVVALLLAKDALALTWDTLVLRTFTVCLPDRTVGCALSSRPVLLLALLAAALLSIGAFVRRRGSPWTGLVALFAVRLSFEAYASVSTVHHQNYYHAGAVFLGLVLGECGAWLSCPKDEAYEERERLFGAMGAIAVFAATYLCAATSKLRFGGVEWASSPAIRLMAISHVEIDGTALIDRLGRFVAGSARLARALEVGTLGVQLGAVLLLVPRMRRPTAAAIVAFHLGILLTSHILFLDALVIAATLAIPWPERSAEPAQTGSAFGGSRIGWLRLAGLSTLVILALEAISPAAMRGQDGFLVRRFKQVPAPATAVLSPELARLLEGLAPGAWVGGFRVVRVLPPEQARVVLELEKSGQAFRVVLVKPGSVPWEPPQRTARFSILSEPKSMATPELDQQRDVALDAFAQILRKNETAPGTFAF